MPSSRRDDIRVKRRLRVQAGTEEGPRVKVRKKRRRGRLAETNRRTGEDAFRANRGKSRGT